uniref:Uncharacterized protein n=1 Tax=Romanomermis culicivorax TaxID=13658 RepID=A0A915KJT9_ROMCU
MFKKVLNPIKIARKFPRFVHSGAGAESSGLNFDLSDQQKQIQQLALKFAKDEILPK